MRNMNDLRFAGIGVLKEILRKKSIYELARDFNVTITNNNGIINKGWIGQTLDRIIQTPHINARLPDGVDFELKSVRGSINLKTGIWEPKETMAITMLSAENMLRETFETSAVWHKMSRLILIGHMYDTTSFKSAKVVSINPIDISDPQLITSLKEYWEMIQKTIQSGAIADYSSKGTSSGLIQLRTKGAGKGRGLSKCPITGQTFNSRAFYATKTFLRYVLGVID